jgi:GNAT superfamily N-acetyltransferase
MRTSAIARVRKARFSANEIRVHLEHVGRPTTWDMPGVELWSAWTSLTSDASPDPPPAEIGRAILYRVDLARCTDFLWELGSFSQDLGEIAAAINKSEGRLEKYHIAPKQFGTIIIAADVVVDKFWRGHRLGPALVFFAADALRANAVFLAPVARLTRLDASGVCFTTLGGRFPGPVAQRKVQAAWRRAGFRDLVDDVVWLRTTNPGNGDTSRKILTKIETLSNLAPARAWWHRRTRRQALRKP